MIRTRPTNTWNTFLQGHGGFFLLASLLTLPSLFLSFYNSINYDVSFLAFVAKGVLGGAVYGVDLKDVNPPLCMLIYMPAAILAKAVGLEWGIRLMMLGLSLLSFAGLWHVAERSIRLPVCVAFILFLTLAYPNHFAQREQIAFLLCTPYVAGASPRQGWALTSGTMAGIAFLMKPHFLIPLALIIAMRRRLGIEERVMFAAAVIYAVVLAVFFQPYLLVMLPNAFATYWAVAYPWREALAQCSFVLLAAVPLALSSPTQATRPYLLATLGFTAAAVFQGKGFYYHYIPAFGLLTMFLAGNLVGQKRSIAIAAGVFLAVEARYLANIMLPWLFLWGEVPPEFRELRSEIDRSSSFISLAIQPGFAFPTAIQTSSHYLGVSSGQGYMSAVEQFAKGKATGDAAAVYRLALDQAKLELGRKPDLVIVAPFGQDGNNWDLLGWYKQDEGFRELWADYRLDRTIAPVTLYRHK